MSNLIQVHPVLPSQDVAVSIDFYVNRLGFTLAFKDAEKPAYAGVRRDSIEIHLQWHDASEWSRIERPLLRFLVSDIDTLFGEWKDTGIFHENTVIRSTMWGTREFAFFDPDMNGLTFYVDV